VLEGGNTTKSRMSSGVLFSGNWRGNKRMEFIVDALTTQNLLDSLSCYRKGSSLFTVFLDFSLLVNCCMTHTTSLLPNGYTVSAKIRTFAEELSNTPRPMLKLIFAKSYQGRANSPCVYRLG
jgi:hypothetical protein